MGLGTAFNSCFGGSKRRHRSRERHGRRRRGLHRRRGKTSRSSAQQGLTIKTGRGEIGERISSMNSSVYASPTSATHEDDFFDAFEEHHTSVSDVSSRGSLEGESPTSSNGQETLFNRIGYLWEDLMDTLFGEEEDHSEGEDERHAKERPESRNGVATGGHPGSLSQSSPSKKVIVESDESVNTGCIGLLTATQAVLAQKKFIKALKGPPAGASFSKRPTTDMRPACAWEAVDSSTFLIRSADYMKTRIKEPSKESIYRILGVDMYSFDRKMNHISRYIDLPRVPELGPGAESTKIPPLLIINIQLPRYSPTLFGNTDGPSYSLVYYFALPDGWEPSMVDNKAALGMLERFCVGGTEADGQATRDRFKLLPRIVNPEEWAKEGPLSGPEVRLLNSYNGKPLLTRPQQSFFLDSAGKYLEVDMDVHKYAYIARRAFYGYMTRLGSVVFENGFVLQGNRREELPELLLGAARAYRVDFTKSKPFPVDTFLDDVDVETT